MKPVGPKGLPYNGGVPRHWQCRSAEIPTTYTWEELGITGLGETRRVVEGGERASMFGPTKARGFDEWLRGLTAEEQDDILGSKRLGSAFRSGQLSSVKQLVDAASGRPLLFREMEAFGLIPPRYPVRAIGAGPNYNAQPGGPGPKYVCSDAQIEDLRQKILDEVRDPKSGYHQFARQIEQLEYEKIDLENELENDKLGHVPLTEAERIAKRKRLKEIAAEKLDLNWKQQGYLSRKYIAPLTGGKADLHVVRGQQARDAAEAALMREQAVIRRELDAVNAQIADLKAKGQPIPAALINEKKKFQKHLNERSLAIQKARNPLNKDVEHAIDEGLDLVSDILGDGSHLNREWGGAQDGTYWHGMKSSEGYDLIDLENRGAAGEKRLHFVFGKETAYSRKGPGGFVLMQDTDAELMQNVVHEIGHHLELTDEQTMRRIHDYFHARTGIDWGRPAHIQGSGWKTAYSEQQAQFLRQYAGHIYGWDYTKPQATEFLSVTFEGLATATDKLAMYDPQSFEFMIRYLTNNWSGWDYSGVFGG